MCQLPTIEYVKESQGYQCPQCLFLGTLCEYNEFYPKTSNLHVLSIS